MYRLTPRYSASGKFRVRKIPCPENSMNDAPPQTDVDEAVRWLRNDGVVVFPTETLYGLGADIFSLPALRRIFGIKGRPADLALPVLVADWEQLETVVQPLDDRSLRLARRFWPGPLTLVLPRSSRVPDMVTGGGNTVAVRMPDHCLPLALAHELGSPITGTSANRSGQGDLMTLDAVESQLGHLVDYIIRTGPEPKGTASTVVDLTSGTPRLVREGAIPFRQVLEAGM